MSVSVFVCDRNDQYQVPTKPFLTRTQVLFKKSIYWNNLEQEAKRFATVYIYIPRKAEEKPLKKSTRELFFF